MRPRAACAALVVLVAMIGVGGCGSGRNAATAVAKEVGPAIRALPQRGGTIPIPRAPVPPVQQPQLPKLADAAQEEAIALVAPHVDDLTESEARQVIVGACTANDLVELGQADSWDDAAGKALTSFGGHATLRYRVADLGDDMAEARSYGDQATKVGAFILCEVA